jgi:hypothetical protein
MGKAEPSIVVNGVQLTPEQAQVTRIAVNSLIMDLGARGMPICQCSKCDGDSEKSRLYLARLSEVVCLMEAGNERKSV